MAPEMVNNIPPAKPASESQEPDGNEAPNGAEDQQVGAMMNGGVADGDPPAADADESSSGSSGSVSSASSTGSSPGSSGSNSGSSTSDDEGDESTGRTGSNEDQGSSSDSPASGSDSSSSDDGITVIIDKIAPDEPKRVPLLDVFPTELSAQFMAPWREDDVLSNSGTSVSSYSEESLCDSCGFCAHRKKRRTTLTVTTCPTTRVILSDLNWEAVEFVPGREQHDFKNNDDEDHHHHHHRRRSDVSSSSPRQDRSDDVTLTPEKPGERPYDPMGGGDDGFFPGRASTPVGAGAGRKPMVFSGGDVPRSSRARTVSFAVSEEEILSSPHSLQRKSPLDGLNPILVTSFLKDDALLPFDDYIIVTWDVEATGLTLSAEIVEIGAFCPGVGKYNEFVMPNREIPRQVSEIHDLWLLKHPCPRFAAEGANIGLYRKSTGKNLDAKYRKDVLSKFVAFLRACSRDASIITSGRIPVGSKIILLSHGGRGIDIPLLLQALQRYPVIETEFFHLVEGFADSLPFLQDYFYDRDQDCPPSLGCIGQMLLGRGRGDGDLAADDAEMLYRVVQQVTDSDMVEHKHIKMHAYTLAAMKDDLADRRIRALKTLTLHPIFDSWLMHPDARVRSMIREMRSTLVAADCQRRYVEKAFWDGNCPCVIAYIRSLLWRLKKLTDKVAQVLVEKRRARMGKVDLDGVDEERADGRADLNRGRLGSDGEEQDRSEESDNDSSKDDDISDAGDSMVFDDSRSDKWDDDERYRNLSKKQKLALAMQGSNFTWRQLKTVILFYVKCLSVDYTPTVEDVKGFHYD